MYFLETHYTIHTLVIIMAAGGILESSGFKVSGDDTTVFYLDDDGAR